MKKSLKKGFKTPTVDSNFSGTASRHRTADDFVMAAGNQSADSRVEFPEDLDTFDIIDNLTALLETGNVDAITAELQQLVLRKAIVGLARDTGIDHEVLKQTLSGTIEPEFSIILKTIQALGMKLTVIDP